MIEDPLETTRLESGHLQLHKSTFDLAALAEAVATNSEATASRPIRSHTGGPALVFADAGRIERVLENLIGNALRYSPPESLVSVLVKADVHEVVVTVVDTGVGIPADELPKLFNRFYRVKGNGGGNGGGSGAGLGLGLYSSRLIIEHHGGRIGRRASRALAARLGSRSPCCGRRLHLHRHPQ